MTNPKPSGPSLGSRAVAVVVLLFAAWVVFQLFKGFIIAVFWTGLIIFGVIAVIWAMRTLRRN